MAIRAGTRCCGEIPLSNVFRWTTKMGTVLVNLFSMERSNKLAQPVSNFKQSGIFHEEAFRYLLEAESKRSKRSGHGYHLLLVYHTDVHGSVAQMDSDAASGVIDALVRSLRETDYIGWYREGRIAGGVLTVVGQDSVGDVHDRVQRRLKEILQANVGGDKNGHFQIRLCRQDELQGIEFGEKAVANQ